MDCCAEAMVTPGNNLVDDMETLSNICNQMSQKYRFIGSSFAISTGHSQSMSRLLVAAYR